MDFKDFPFGQDDTDRRLDKIIRRFLPDRSLSEVYGLIRKGLVRINGKKTKENYRISEGDVLNIAEFLCQKLSEAAPDTPSEKPENRSKIDINKLIVFKNEHLLILNKPYDIKVHGDSDSLDTAVKAWYEKNVSNDSLSFKSGPLHRLDRKTTGLLVFSLSSQGARWFTENLENHVIRKTYLGIMEGAFPEKARWEDKICKVEDQKGFVTVKKDDENGKTAITNAKPLEYKEIRGFKTTLTEYDIETGRTHQIRCQSSIHGFPLFGDTAYGSSKQKGLSRDFYLHAWKLHFPKDNPLNLPETVTCNPDKDFLFV